MQASGGAATVLGDRIPRVQGVYHSAPPEFHKKFRTRGAREKFGFCRLAKGGDQVRMQWHQARRGRVCTIIMFAAWTRRPLVARPHAPLDMLETSSSSISFVLCSPWLTLYLSKFDCWHDGGWYCQPKAAESRFECGRLQQLPRVVNCHLRRSKISNTPLRSRSQLEPDRATRPIG